MFERYTEKARRTIFFSRYEASQFGCSQIGPEHILLRLIREDKPLATQFLASYSNVEAIRHSIGQRERTTIATSVDLPLSHESKRVLAYAAEESERMKHKHIGTPHLLLGLLREEKSLAAQLLRGEGLTLESVRERVQRTEIPLAESRSAFFARLDQWLAELEARGRIWVFRQKRISRRVAYAAIYAGDAPNEDEKSQALAPSEKLAQIQNRIDFIDAAMERAIANHEFEKARFYSDEERKEREKLRLLREQFNLEEPQPRVPLLCIKV